MAGSFVSSVPDLVVSTQYDDQVFEFDASLALFDVTSANNAAGSELGFAVQSRIGYVFGTEEMPSALALHGPTASVRPPMPAFRTGSIRHAPLTDFERNEAASLTLSGIHYWSPEWSSAASFGVQYLAFTSDAAAAV